MATGKRTTVRSTTAEGDDRRAHIIDRSIAVLSAQGYRATTMFDIADACGMSKSSIYHYFAGKEELLVAIVTAVLEDNLRAARAIDDSDLGTEAKLRRMLADRVVYTCWNQRILQVYFEEEAELPERLLREVNATRKGYIDVMKRLIAQGAEEGIFEPTASPRLVVYTFVGSINWIYKWYSPQSRLEPEALADEMTDLLMRSILSAGR